MTLKITFHDFKNDNITCLEGAIKRLKGLKLATEDFVSLKKPRSTM
jgi:hypothetical protein